MYFQHYFLQKEAGGKKQWDWAPRCNLKPALLTRRHRQLNCWVVLSVCCPAKTLDNTLLCLAEANVGLSHLISKSSRIIRSEKREVLSQNLACLVITCNWRVFITPRHVKQSDTAPPIYHHPEFLCIWHLYLLPRWISHFPIFSYVRPGLWSISGLRGPGNSLILLSMTIYPHINLHPSTGWEVGGGWCPGPSGLGIITREDIADLTLSSLSA